jgi:hypothetical protein
MAIVTVGMPIFSGEPDEDVHRHVELFTGYIDGLGINPVDIAGAPTGERRTLGLFRASLTGKAGIWFDETFIGKHWELHNLYDNHGQNAWANLITRNMQQLVASNSFRNPSDAYTYATTPGNNATALNASGLYPARGLIQDWGAIGGRLTDRSPTLTGAGGAGVTVVLPDIRLGNVIYWFKTNYETIQRARREAKFGDLVQGDMPIDAYYKQIIDTGKLLNYPVEYIERQFFRGLNDENLLEAERQGDKPLGELVDSLKKIEKRKTEMKIGIQRRNARTDLQQYNIAPVQAPPVISAQEPNILKPVTSHAITQDMLNNLLKSHTENLTNSFQNQIQTLQNTISQLQQPPKKVPPPVPHRNHPKDQQFTRLTQDEIDEDWYMNQGGQFVDYSYPDPSSKDNRTDEDYLRMLYGDNFEILPKAPPKSKNVILAAKALAKAQRAKENRQVDRLAQLLEDKLDLNDDPMDTTNLMDEIILQDADGNEFTAYVTRSKRSKKK